MTPFWTGFEKRAEEARRDDAAPEPRTTSFMRGAGLGSKQRGDEHVKNEHDHCTTGGMGD